MVEITLTHVVYIAFALGILWLMYNRKDTVLFTLIGLFVVSTLATQSLIGGAQGLFNAVYQAAIGMFIIPILIAVIFAMTAIMKDTGTDYIMVAPLRGLLGRPMWSYWMLGIIMFVLSLFFWPTAAAGLVGCILVPVAVAAGMTPIVAALPLAMFGHGGALGGDWVLQGAPTILSKVSGLPIDEILSTSTFIIGSTLAVASVVSFFMNLKDMRNGKELEHSCEFTSAGSYKNVHKGAACSIPKASSNAKAFAVLIPVVLFTDVAIMIKNKLIGSDATALLGGTVFLLVAIMCVFEYKSEALPKTTEYLKAGFVFAIEIFTPVFVISAFFLIGSAEGSVAVFGAGASGYLIDWGQWVAALGAVNKAVVAVVMAVVASMTGLDGAGFAQLPLVGSLATSLAPAVGANPVPLAVLGQMCTIWTAGALAPWGFLAALAAFCGVSPVEVARRNFIPSMAGFAAGIVIAIILM